MPVKLKITVTKDVLKRSMMCGVDEECLSTTNCAIAVVVRDIFPHASVGNQAIYPFYHDKTHRDYYRVADSWTPIHLPDDAQFFILKFDKLRQNPEARLDLPELEFEVEIPDEVIEQIDIEGIRPLLVNHPTLELV